MLAQPFVAPSLYGSSPRTLQTSFAPPLLLPSSFVIGTAMATFNSTIAIAADQLATAPQLEPAFEHLLRNSTVHESVIGVLRINSITDRDTFVNMFDSEAALKDGASDLGFDLSTGGLPHKREFARGNPQKLCLRLSARQTLLLEPLLPCDWTSILTEFKNKFGKHIRGKPPRQVPSFPTILLAAFEDMVLAVDKPVFLRVLSWWLLVQSWGTLRFDDHRGLLPREFVVTSTGLQARLTRSKVSGSDKHLNYRTVIIHPSAYIQRESWLSVGWKLLQCRHILFPRLLTED